MGHKAEWIPKESEHNLIINIQFASDSKCLNRHVDKR